MQEYRQHQHQRWLQSRNVEGGTRLPPICTNPPQPSVPTRVQTTSFIPQSVNVPSHSNNYPQVQQQSPLPRRERSYSGVSLRVNPLQQPHEVTDSQLAQMFQRVSVEDQNQVPIRRSQQPTPTSEELLRLAEQHRMAAITLQQRALEAHQSTLNQRPPVFQHQLQIQQHRPQGVPVLPQIRFPSMVPHHHVHQQHLLQHQQHLQQHQLQQRLHQQQRQYLVDLGNVVQSLMSGNAPPNYESFVQLSDVERGASSNQIQDCTSVFILEKRIESGESKDCSICMDEFDQGHEVRCLPCFHMFHRPCADEWLTRNKVCPICRKDILELHEQVTGSQ